MRKSALIFATILITSQAWGIERKPKTKKLVLDTAQEKLQSSLKYDKVEIHPVYRNTTFSCCEITIETFEGNPNIEEGKKPDSNHVLKILASLNQEELEITGVIDEDDKYPDERMMQKINSEKERTVLSGVLKDIYSHSDLFS